jgi:hypothetical protein
MENALSGGVTSLTAVTHLSSCKTVYAAELNIAACPDLYNSILELTYLVR